MVNIVIGTSLNRKTVQATLDQTPKQLLDAAEIDLNVGTIHMDSCPLTVQDINKTLADLNVKAGETHILVSIVKADSAVKLQKCGDSLTLKTEITQEVFENCQKLAPEALKLISVDGKETFRVAKASIGSIAPNGVAFTSHDADGKLYITAIVEPGDFVNKEDIAREFAVVLDNMKTVEAQVAEARDEIEARIASVEDCVTIS